ncbi:MAG TPA: ribonuclease HI family protein [Candidatus Babeliales bacterium]|jgi:ribonuclease HI|nr:ribonuclease HI family protein [Candidatus Babeliales bacterium]
MKKMITWKLFVDGASRKNPGPSGAGMYIEKDGIAEIKEGFYVGIKTNNQAEYLALIFGLLILKDHVSHGDMIHVISDSQLLVRQLIGEYKVKQPHLQPLHALCRDLIHKYSAIITHVLRDENKQADKMANYGIDCKNIPPKKYIELLQEHGIFL